MTPSPRSKLSGGPTLNKRPKPRLYQRIPPMGGSRYDDGSGALASLGCVTLVPLFALGLAVLALAAVISGCSTLPNYPKVVEDDGYLVECGKPYTREEDRRGIEHDCTYYGGNSISDGYA